METRHVSELTIEEFRALIGEVVREELLIQPNISRRRSADEVLDSVLHNIIVRSPDEPSTLEMLREDQDR